MSVVMRRSAFCLFQFTEVFGLNRINKTFVVMRRSAFCLFQFQPGQETFSYDWGTLVVMRRSAFCLFQWHAWEEEVEDIESAKS